MRPTDDKPDPDNDALQPSNARQEPTAALPAGIDLADVEAGNLNIGSVVAQGGGVNIKRSKFAGNITINSVQAGEPARSPTSPPQAAPSTADTQAGMPIQAGMRPCILVLAANPLNLQRSPYDEEIRAIDQALRRAGTATHFDVRYHVALRIDDLQELLLRYNPAIVHFCGHGQASGAIILQDQEGQARPVDPLALAHLFALFQNHVRCVVLNACYSAVQAGAIAEHIAVVIGMTDKFTDQTAVEFAAAFYQALAYGCNLRIAFDLARNQIELAGSDETQIPQLLALHTDPASILLINR